MNTLHPGIKWTCEKEKEGRQPWKEKAGAIRTLKNRAHTYCSDEYLLAEELSYLLGGFMKNGYPEKVVYRILYEEVKTTKQQQQGDKTTDSAHVFYVPYHSRAKRLYNILLEQFEITTIFKKTATLGNLIRRKSRHFFSSIGGQVVRQPVQQLTS